jgi:hypothetical protein
MLLSLPAVVEAEAALTVEGQGEDQPSSLALSGRIARYDHGGEHGQLDRLDGLVGSDEPDISNPLNPINSMQMNTNMPPPARLPGRGRVAGCVPRVLRLGLRLCLCRLRRRCRYCLILHLLPLPQPRPPPLPLQPRPPPHPLPLDPPRKHARGLVLCIRG